MVYYGKHTQDVSHMSVAERTWKLKYLAETKRKEKKQNDDYAKSMRNRKR